MGALFFSANDREFLDHPKFAGVRIAVLVKRENSDAVSVSELEIDSGVEIPRHTHDTQLDSIYCISGEAEAFVKGKWTKVAAGDYIFVPPNDEHGIRNIGDQHLRLFIHHSPPMY